MKKVFLSIAMVSALLSSCGTANKSVNLSGEWNIVSVSGQEVTADKDAYIGFDMEKGRLYGNAGCNNIMASVSVDAKKNTVELSNVASTRKMCMDMKLEEQVLNALGKVTSYKTTDNGIELTDAEGNILFGLEKMDAADVKASDLDGEWFISKVNGNAVKVVEKVPFIAFDAAAKKVHGTGGCNIFNGDFSQKKNESSSLIFGDLATTMMAGPGMEQEGTILPEFEKVRSFIKNANGTISLLDADKKEVIVLKKNNGKSLVEE